MNPEFTKTTANFSLYVSEKATPPTLLLFFILIFSFGIPAPSYAQKEKKPLIGLKGGINFAELFGEDAIPESDRKVGYSFGIFASLKISREIKLQPEVIWSLQGEKSDNKGRYDISYINIPVMIKWQQKKFFTEFGPQLGILTLNSSKSVPEDKILKDFETFDLSMNAGMGFQLLEDLGVGIRYCQGLTNLVQGMDLKNSVLYLGISYRIF